MSAIGQGEVLATPLQMATVAQTIGNGGVREPTSLVANPKLRPEAKPVRVMSKQIAERADRTDGRRRHRRHRLPPVPSPRPRSPARPAPPSSAPSPARKAKKNPEQIKDAWFAAFAPAEKARLAVGVLLIEAEAAGGEVAAPVAGQVLSAGL